MHSHSLFPMCLSIGTYSENTESRLHFCVTQQVRINIFNVLNDSCLLSGFRSGRGITIYAANCLIGSNAYITDHFLTIKIICDMNQ